MVEREDAHPGTPPDWNYPLGWGELTIDWALYPLLYHGGFNSLNLVHIWPDAKKDPPLS
jgi:hypothetical protein